MPRRADARKSTLGETVALQFVAAMRHAFVQPPSTRFENTDSHRCMRHGLSESPALAQLRHAVIIAFRLPAGDCSGSINPSIVRVLRCVFSFRDRGPILGHCSAGAMSWDLQVRCLRRPPSISHRTPPIPLDALKRSRVKHLPIQATSIGRADDIS